MGVWCPNFKIFVVPTILAASSMSGVLGMSVPLELFLRVLPYRTMTYIWWDIIISLRLIFLV